jgi:glycosyltransferase involved in cell wall biosynthesis
MLNFSEKKICLINSNKEWGGGEKWHFEFAHRLSKAGYQVFAITNPDTDLYFKLKASGLPVLSLKITNLSFLNPCKIFQIYRFFKKNHIQLAIFGLSSDLKIGGIAAKLARFKKILYRRGSAVPVKNSWLNRFLFKHVLTGVIVNSLEIKRALLQNNPDLIDQNKIYLLYNCIDTKDISIAVSDTKYPTKKNGEIWLGNVGRLVEQKGQKYLIELAKILKDKNIKFRLLIAGKGNLENSLKEYAETLKVENEIDFLGFVPDISSFMQKIDVFLLASLHEGSANVLLEAMACSKPVVAFKVSSISEIVLHNHTGYLAEFINVHDFSDWVERLIENPDIRKQMGNNGKQRIEEHFSATKTMQELLCIIE